MKNNLTSNNSPKASPASFLKGNKFIGSYLTFEHAFSVAECESLIKLFQENLSVKADSLTTNSEICITNADVVELNVLENDWVVKRLTGYVDKANQYLNLDINELKELQIIKRTENSFTEWHYDFGKGDTATRKMSIVVFLSKQDDYQGGQITFSMVEPKIDEIVQTQGRILLFPSFRPHMNQILTKGAKYTLNAWVHGNSFR